MPKPPDEGPYRYEPLDIYTRQIRLLKLGRKFGNSTPKCELIHVSLDAAPEYEAISYTWGVPDRHCSVLIDGRYLSISTRVAKLLGDLSSAMATRVVWIDSICINQDSYTAEEKSHQVSLMREIYYKAKRVIIWLGDGPSAKLVVSTFRALQQKIQNQESGKPIEPLAMALKTRSAVHAFLDNPFWYRMWIIQEIAVARSILIMYGQAQMPWDVFEPVIKNVFIDGENLSRSRYISGWLHKPLEAPFSVMMMHRTICRHAGTGLDTLQNFIWSTRRSKCTDPRDKVFALLGLIQDADSQLLWPDYSKSAPEVYRDAALYLISGEDPLRILHYAGIRPGKMDNIPSWIPDWSLEAEGGCLGRKLRSDPYRASLDERAEIIVASRSILCTKGVLVDKIAQITPTSIEAKAKPGEEAMSAILEDWSWHAQACRLAIPDVDTGLSSYGGGQSFLEAFWRTLVADRTPSHEEIHAEDDELFASYIAWCTAHEAALKVGFEAGLLHPGRVDPPSWFLEYVRTYAATMDVSSSPSAAARYADFAQALGGASFNRKFAVTVGKRLALVPKSAQVGDEIWVVIGSETPHCLRQYYPSTDHRGTPAGRPLQLLGECYMHGIMNGEVMAHLNRAADIALW